MADPTKYEKYLGKSEFVKYGMICSSLVWGKSYAEISLVFQVSKQYVSQVIKRWTDEETFEDKRIFNGGSNRKIKEAERTSMIDLIENDRSTSLRQISHGLHEKFNLTIAPTTIGTSLKDIGFIKTKPEKIPYLSNSAIKKRLEYATKHLEDKYTNVCFSDETIFQLSDNRQFMWWNQNTEDRPFIEDHSKKNKVMLWGGISRKGKTELYYWKISKDLTVDAFEYTECLEQVLFERMNILYGVNKWRFMHDNARPHTAFHTTTFLDKNNIKRIVHPPYSPDLNPIEFVWGYLKNKVMIQVYETIDDIIDKIIEEWEKIPMQLINKFIDKHCERVKEVYELNGEFK